MIEDTDNKKSDDGTNCDDDNRVSLCDLFSFANSSLCKIYLFLGVLFAFVSGLLYPIFAYYMSSMFKQLAASASSDSFMTSLEKVVYALLVLSVIGLISLSLQDAFLVRAATDMSISMQKQWFDALLHEDISTHDKENLASNSSLMTVSASKYKRGVGRKLGLGIQYSISSIGCFALAFTFSWKTSLILLSALPLMGVNAYLILRVTSVKQANSIESYKKAGSIVYTTASAIRTVLSLNACQTMISKFENATNTILKAAKKSLPWIAIGNGALFTLIDVIFLVFTLFGSYLLYDDVRKTGCDPTGTTPNVETCSESSMDLFGSLLGILFGCAGFPQVSVAFEAVNDARSACYLAKKFIDKNARSGTFGIMKSNQTYDEESFPNEEISQTNTVNKVVISSNSSKGQKPKSCSGEIEFKEVSFAYPTRKEHEVLSQFSLKINTGELVAIVGPSGCGKSTVMQLIERFYDPIAGAIQLDGIDIRSLNVKWLREQIALVSQEPTLFATSVKENISFGCYGVSQDEIETAAKAANAHDFILTFPEGYDTIVGDRGALLSGGQKQRIAIARALVKKPKILLLDEATSALDSKSEYEVQQTIDKLFSSKEQTTIVIAHRLSTIRNADKIAVIKDKRVVETGTYTELLDLEGSEFKAIVSAKSDNDKKEKVENPWNNDIDSNNQTKTEQGVQLTGDESQALNQVVFHNVGFSYPSRPNHTVFQNLNITVRKGETLGIVGSSGCGKSSLINLLERFYDPQDGSIYFEGHDLKSVNVDWLRSQLGLVSQEPTLFQGTINENIKFGCPTASQSDIEEASKQANAHNFIKSFPSAYETDVGELGTKLSGGQKQRIALARALLRKPKILLLDEATSALDNESEILVQAALDKIMKNSDLTTIVVAHRFSTIRNADRIAVVKEGKIHELGSHDELLSMKNSYYKHLYELQSITTDQDRYNEDESTKSGTETKGIEGQDDFVSNSFVESDQSTKQHTNRSRLLAKEDCFYLCIGIFGAILTGLTFPLTGVLFAYMIDLFFKPMQICDAAVKMKYGTCQDYWNHEADNMRKMSFDISYGFIAAALATLIGYLFLYNGFGYAAERMNKRIRDSVFKSLIRQEVSYFDTQQIGNIASQIEDDAAMIHSFSGEPLKTLFINVSSVLLGIIVVFIYMWEFALLTLGILPFMAFGAEMEMKMMMVEEEAETMKQDESSPSGIATEALLNIRTVASLAIENVISKKFLEAVQASTSTNLYFLFKKGLAVGMGFFVQMAGFGLMFWFGGWLLQKYPEKYTYLDFNIATMTFFNSLYGFAVAAQGATDGKQAKDAANRIFALIDRKSSIDPLDSEGKKEN